LFLVYVRLFSSIFMDPLNQSVNSISVELFKNLSVGAIHQELYTAVDRANDERDRG